MKFRKRPIVIEAWQWWPPEEFDPDIEFQPGSSPGHPEWHGKHDGWLIEGYHECTPGDWIVTGIKGEHYPVKPDIFEMTYEWVE